MLYYIQSKQNCIDTRPELSRLATQYICKYFFFSFFAWGGGGGEEGGICGAILC